MSTATVPPHVPSPQPHALAVRQIHAIASSARRVRLTLAIDCAPGTANAVLAALPRALTPEVLHVLTDAVQRATLPAPHVVDPCDASTWVPPGHEAVLR